ncbi:carbohydrate ABC transporter permease [Arthrobacter sp. B2a2-09]|uniref:carbohydrate ABC transporter permease n=1 Tax=Arthrobacter sp. B2a2-09 TaxID=2952822 RepID=UPI0022CD4C59|nr:sugar ABC transporter permease [Arthrobacter sp. B2a2-09]MCZ9883665.1 sugar ABC transporter permease [Arthrobacter sp. B2a2-09]
MALATVPKSAAGDATISRRRAANHSRARAQAIPFLLPALGLVAIMLLVPFAVTVYQSFTSDNGITSSFIGLQNYGDLINDPSFVRSLANTFMWTIGTLILPVGVGLLVAILTNSIPGGRWLRFAFVLPYAISGASTAVIWGFILRSDGALNQAIRFFGLTPPSSGWLLEWPNNTLVMIVANTWQATGVCVILFLVGLQAIPAETLEAGSLDGASGARLFWHIVFPQLRPVMIVVIGMSIANSLRVFDLIWLLTKGGPGSVSETLAVTMYRQTFILSDYGAGAAVAVVLAIIVVASSWLYLQRQLKKG